MPHEFDGLADQLPDLEARLAEAEREYQAAYKRSRLLKATIENIKTLTSLDAIPEASITNAHAAPIDTGTAAGIQAVTAAVTVPPAVNVGVGGGGIRNGILHLLNGSNHSWELPELEYSLREMGFMPPGLKTPRETVRNAANRLAMNNGLIQRIGSSAWVRLSPEDEPGVGLSPEDALVEGEESLDLMREATSGN